jgi:hypothetical protein
MTTGKPGHPVSERTLRVFGHHRLSKKGASLRKESVNFSRARLAMSMFPQSFVSTLTCTYGIYYGIQ